MTGTPKNSGDKFLLYQVQQHDLVKRIAKHYEVNPNQIAKDNQVYDNQLTEAETILFIRNPKTDEPYTPAPMTLQDQKLLESLLLGRNLECMLNLEPINMSTGNFFMQQSDADLEELDGSFAIERSYNSRDDEYRSVFGMGWSSPLDSHLTVLKDGRILFKRGDGAGITFKKEGDIYQAPDGRDITLEALDSLDIIVDDSTDERSEEESGEESESDSAADAVLEQSSYLSSRFMTLATEYEDEESETEEDGATETTEEDEVTPLEYPAGWKMTDLDGTVRVFDALGFLQYTEDRKGHRTTYVYSSDYELRRIETASGKQFDVTMNEEYLITEISLPNGGTISYGYDDDRNLTDVTDPEGGVRRYEYDDAHHMTAWYDENGSRIVSNEYDGQDVSPARRMPWEVSAPFPTAKA